VHSVTAIFYTIFLLSYHNYHVTLSITICVLFNRVLVSYQ